MTEVTRPQPLVERWSRGGVNNNTAEAFQRVLKSAFVAGYSYVSPERMPLYLAEFSSLKAIRHYGIERLVRGGSNSWEHLNQQITP